MNKIYRNIVFDLGGVMVDWNPEQFVKDVFSDKECMPMEFWLELTSSDYWKNLDAGVLLESDFLKQIPEKYNKKQVSFFLQKLPKLHVVLQKGLDIFNEIKSLGYKIYILSNFPEDRFKKAACMYHFLNNVDGAVFSYEYKIVKPNPELYKALLNKYKLNAEDCFFIDDSSENIKAAKQLGIDGIVCCDHDFVFAELKRLGILFDK